MRIVFHPEAYEEMLESARFYEQRGRNYNELQPAIICTPQTPAERFNVDIRPLAVSRL
jgi:hypothetical protein